VSVKVVDEQAAASDPPQLCEKLHGVRAVKVMEEERRVHDIDRVVRTGQVLSVRNLDADARSERRRQVGV
jgi:hypothetical protein